MTAEETKAMLLAAAASAGDDHSVVEWFEQEGIHRETMEDWLKLVSSMHEEMPAIVLIGAGFHMGWEGRKVVAG